MKLNNIVPSSSLAVILFAGVRLERRARRGALRVLTARCRADAATRVGVIVGARRSTTERVCRGDLTLGRRSAPNEGGICTSEAKASSLMCELDIRELRRGLLTCERINSKKQVNSAHVYAADRASLDQL